MHIARRSPIWATWVGADILKSVYLRSFLTIRNFATFRTNVKNEATVEPCGYV